MEPLIKLVGLHSLHIAEKCAPHCVTGVSPYQWIRQYSPASKAQPPVKIDHMIPVLWFSHETEFKCQIDGRTWQQKPFLYQGKCLHWLRDTFIGLNNADKKQAFDLLEAFNCETLVNI